jgi:hypothetical protein
MINKQAAKEKIESLVTRFGDQFDSYKNSDYNEKLTRRAGRKQHGKADISGRS